MLKYVYWHIIIYFVPPQNLAVVLFSLYLCMVNNN